MDQFTIYDLYYETFNGLKDEEIGILIKRICNYALYDLEEEKMVEVINKLKKGLEKEKIL